MAVELGTGYVSIVPETKGLAGKVEKTLGDSGVAGSNRITKALGSVQSTMTQILGSADKTTVRAGIAGAALVGVGMGIEKVMGKATQTAKDYGSEVVLLQRLTGASAKESSTWAAILGRYNVTGKKAALVVKSLSTAINDQSGDLNALGVATQNADGSNRTSMEVLGDLAEKYKQAKDKTQVLAVGTKTLGRGFADLLPLLASGKKGIEEIAKAAEENGLIFSDADVQSIKDYNKALKENEQVVKGAQVQVGLATLPFETFKTKAIGDTLKGLRDLNPELPKLAGGVGSVAGPLASVSGKALLFVAALPYINAGLNTIATTAGAAGFTLTEVSLGLQSIASGVSLSSLYSAGGGLAAVAAGVTTLGIALAALAVNYVTWEAAKASADSNSANKAREHAKAIGSATGAQATWTSAVSKTVTSGKELNGTYTQGIALSKKVADATGEGAAQQERMIRDIYGRIVAENTLRGALRTAQDAELNYRSSVLDSRAAHKELNRLRKEGKQGTEEFARAEIAAAEADQRLADATQFAREEQHKANTALVAGTTDTKALTKAGAEYVTKLNAATDRVQALKAKLDTVPKAKRAEVQADIKKAQANVDHIKKQIAEIKDKYVKVRVSATGGGVMRAVVDGQLTRFIVNAAGGLYKGATAAIVGEASPRLGEYVINADRAAKGDPRQLGLMASLMNAVTGGAQAQSSGINVNVLGDYIDPNQIQMLAFRGARAALATSRYL